MTEQDAIETLLALGNSTVLTPVSTPTRPMVTVEKPAITPERSLKPAGYKRVRSDLIHIIYESEKGERMMVPLAKGENSDVFNTRRRGRGR